MAARNLAQTAPPTTGYRIGRYSIRARLGKGGMGVVYLGRDEALDRDVAVKTLRVDGSQDDESRGRFEIEAKAAARLQHPNIVTVFELGEDRGLPFIAMELLGGEDLETLLRSKEPLSATERLDIAIQTLRGLDFAHAHQIVHRDMKPSNIRVLDDGGVKILDFGIAKVESTAVTRAGMMVGTPYYMSPEHIRGGTLDGRSDVFAVGVILHELFAGKRPFSADDPTRVLYRIVNEPHPRLTLDAAGPLTAEVQRVIDKALEKNADHRFGSAALMADELTRVRERYPSPTLASEDLAALSQARRQLTLDSNNPAMMKTVERIAVANPDATEAQRLLRLFKRKPVSHAGEANTLSFPELDATFAKATGPDETAVLAGPTISGRAHTLNGASPGTSGGRSSNAILYVALAACLLTGSAALYLYMTRTANNETTVADPTPQIQEIFVPEVGTEVDTSGQAATAPRPGASPASGRTAPTAVPVVPKKLIEITSDPAGASVRIAREVVGVTPLRTEVTSNEALTLSLSMSGYQSKEVRVDLPLPASVNATLTPSGPPAQFAVRSAYPVTVSVSGRVIASEKSEVNTTLPAGAYDVVIESTQTFLRHRQSVRLDEGGSFSYQAPGTGKVGVRASPDNCKVFVNGVFVDYPPIIDRTIAAGDHVVSFEWPDGSKSQERVTIREGRPSYVMGRKP